MLGDDYGGLLGAFPYAVRHSRSWLFRSYTLLAGLLVVFTSTAMVLALVTLFGNTANLQGGSVTLSRAFYGVVWLLVLFPLVAPVLAVARRHRRSDEAGTDGPGARHDTSFALAGYLFIASLYVMLLASIPPSLQDPPSAAGPLEPVVAALYGLPAVAGLVFPVVATALLAALWWRTR